MPLVPPAVLAPPVFRSFFPRVPIHVVRAGGDAEGSFPPPKGSLLRTTIDTLRQERHIAPRVVLAKPGTPQETIFEQMLIEEAGGHDGTSYAHFVNSILEQVEKLCSSSS